MKTILLLHGPNLNLLGKRDVRHYGTLTLADIERLTREEAGKWGYALLAFQSAYEGRLIELLQEMSPECAGIIINPGALAHYSYALHDALVDTGRPAIEVHLSDIARREAFRRHTVTGAACLRVISGKKEQGYLEAVQSLKEHLAHAD